MTVVRWYLRRAGESDKLGEVASPSVTLQIRCESGLQSSLVLQRRRCVGAGGLLEAFLPVHLCLSNVSSSLLKLAKHSSSTRSDIQCALFIFSPTFLEPYESSEAVSSYESCVGKAPKSARPSRPCASLWKTLACWAIWWCSEGKTYVKSACLHERSGAAFHV